MAEPVLQIIHVSDLHVAVGPNPPRVEWMLRKTARLPLLRSIVREGVAPYDTKAPRYFTATVDRFTIGQYRWSGPTWLVDTGDLTTFGDDASLSAGRGYLDGFAARTTRRLSLHGNHDAWPRDFPLGASDAEIQAHRGALRGVWFPNTWPESPCEVRGPVTVQLYGLNSVLHTQWRNAFAFGMIDHDRYWDDGLPSPSPEQDLDRLEALVGRHDPDRTAFRILATHHPLCCAGGAPWDHVSNRRAVVDRLAPAREEPPLIHLVLSGHTHELFPPHGELPRDVTGCAHDPLVENQAQLVVGALMQDSPRAIAAPPKPPDPPRHQAEVLRIYWHASDRIVELRRCLLARNSGEPGYRIIPVPGKAGVEESLRFSLG